MTKRRIIVVLIAIIFVLSLIPFNTTFVPEWKLRVIDETGKPYIGEFVSQYCTNYTMGIHPCEGVDDQRQTTDENGYVVFPARKLRASLLYRIVRPILGLLLLIANGEHGTNGSVAGPGASLNYKPGEPLPHEFVITRRK